jgi:hypothetical protein
MKEYDIKITIVRANGKSEIAGTQKSYSSVSALKKFMNEEMIDEVNDDELIISVKETK